MNRVVRALAPALIAQMRTPSGAFLLNLLSAGAADAVSGHMAIMA